MIIVNHEFYTHSYIMQSKKKKYKIEILKKVKYITLFLVNIICIYFRKPIRWLLQHVITANKRKKLDGLTEFLDESHSSLHLTILSTAKNVLNLQ